MIYLKKNKKRKKKTKTIHHFFLFTTQIELLSTFPFQKYFSHYFAVLTSN